MNSNITIKLWHDGKAPRLTIGYENPEQLWAGNGHSYLQMRKMLSDYFQRKDITVDVKADIYTALEFLAKAHIANTTPSKEEIKNQVAKDMNRLYNTNLPTAQQQEKV